MRHVPLCELPQQGADSSKGSSSLGTTPLAHIDAMKVVEPDGYGAPNSIPVVDLFSGPGGLAEGFAGYRDAAGQPRFRIALSVEMEKCAYRTLLLRAFLRQFSSTGFPSEYYDFLNGDQETAG